MANENLRILPTANFTIKSAVTLAPHIAGRFKTGPVELLFRGNLTFPLVDNDRIHVPLTA